MASHSFINALTAALDDEAVVKKLASIISLCSREEFHPVVKRLEAAVERLDKELKVKETEIVQLCNEQSELMSNVDELHTRINNLKQNSKRNNLLLHGIPESFTEVVLRGDEADEHINSSEHLLSKVSDVISEHLHIDLHRSDLLAVHRLSSKEKSFGVQRPGVPRPILLQFARHNRRDEIFRAKKLLKGFRMDNHPVYFNEHLTPYNLALLNNAKQAIKSSSIYDQAWSYNCKAYVNKKATASAKAKKVLIANEYDLRSVK